MNEHQLKLNTWIEARAAEAEPNFLAVMARDQRANVLDPMRYKLTS
jgi:hypothetical protein